MRVTALVHFYPPYRLAGSETMLHTMLKALAEAGHQVSAVTTAMPEAPREWMHEGVRAFSAISVNTAAELTTRLRPRVIISHHDHSSTAVATARSIGARSVFLQHNSFDINRQTLGMSPDLVVFNTEWIARAWHEETSGRWMVVHPPVWPHEHAVEPGECVTLVNLNEHKGVHVFAKLAQTFPDVPFLGVTGGHGQQVTGGFSENVTVIGQTNDMPGDVWSRTKVLLMPSVYESYGMAGVEALASGIPVIANPTPGLKEALGPAGIFADREDIHQWATELRTLLRMPDAWQAASGRALERSQELDPEPELTGWVRAVEELGAQQRVPQLARWYPG